MPPIAASATAGMIGLAIFIVFFGFVIAYLVRKGAKEEGAQNAMIPFKED